MTLFQHLTNINNLVVTKNKYRNNDNDNNNIDFFLLNSIFFFIKWKKVSVDTYLSFDYIFRIINIQNLNNSLTKSSKSRLGSSQDKYIYFYNCL